MRPLRVMIIFLTCLLMPRLLFADTFYLKNGNIVKGFIDKETSDKLEVDLGYGTAIFSKNEIARIVKSNEKESEALWRQWDRRKKEEDRRAPEVAKILMAREAAASIEQARWTESDERNGKVVHAKTANGHFFLDVLLNGKVHANLLLDSGATFILLPHYVADQLEIDTDKLKKQNVSVADGRTVQVSECLIKTVEILNIESKDEDSLKPTGIKADNILTVFLAKSDSTVQEAPKTSAAGVGLLGMSFLNHFKIKLDYENQKLIFQKTDAA